MLWRAVNQSFLKIRTINSFRDRKIYSKNWCQPSLETPWLSRKRTVRFVSSVSMSGYLATKQLEIGRITEEPELGKVCPAVQSHRSCIVCCEIIWFRMLCTTSNYLANSQATFHKTRRAFNRSWEHQLLISKSSLVKYYHIYGEFANCQI